MTSRPRVERALAMIAGPLSRLRESVEDDGQLFPLSAGSFDRQSRKALDAFLQRFQQVYDILARKLMPAMHAYLVADARPRSFRDTLDAFERLELIDSADRWEELNELRNRLIHEYALDDATRAQELNAAFALTAMIEATAERFARAIVGDNFNSQGGDPQA